MKNANHTTGRAGMVLCGALAVALTSCTTYVEERRPRAAYVSPPPVEVTPAPPAVVVAPAEAPVVVIQAESDFYEPLNPYGTWVVVGSYGRCWRPARVDAAWRPYCDGHWQRTDAGWYWASDEPWGWATYHYGRWDWSVNFGWIWVPHVQWAPAWVSWRQGAGYVGWAPLPPSARIGSRGIMEVRDTAVAPRGFVFVSEQRLLEPVRPTTVVVNNTTIINQTVNITKVQVVNQTVINEGPRPEVIERKSGRKVEAVPVRELRRREETEVVAKQRNIPTRSGKTDQRPPIAESTPGRTIPGREVNRSQQPATVPARVQPSTGKNETRVTGAADSPNKLERDGREIPARKEPGQESKSINARPDSNPAATASEGKSQARPGAPVPARGTAQTERPSGTANRPQPPVVGNGNRSVGEVKSSERPAQPATEKQMGHERQRALGRGSEKTGAQNPAQVRKPAQPPANRQAVKPKPSGKSAVKERSSPKAKKDGEQETPQPANPPGQPRQPN